MGTRRLWLAVLLALLQYAAVQAAPTGCENAPKPISKCNKREGCDDGFLKDQPCPAAFPNLYYSEDNAEPWKKLEKIECTGGIWTAKDADGVTSYPLTLKDNVLCSIKDPAFCPTAPQPKSVCPVGFPTGVCVKKGRPENVCGDSKNFYDKNGAGVWKEADSVECDKATTKWTAYVGKDAAKTKVDTLTDADNLICIADDPTLACMKCTALPSDPSVCDASGGCVVGGARGFPKESCMTMNCTISGEFFLTDTQKAVDKINCDGTKWMSVGLTPEVEVKHAVCVKIDCTKKTPLKSACSGLAPWGCDTIPFTDDSDKTCTGKKLFIKKTGAAAWKEADQLHCESKSGAWTTTETEGSVKTTLAKDDEVICATEKPVPCSPTFLTSDCDGTVNTAVECAPLVPIPTSGALSCPPSPSVTNTLYHKEGDLARWETGSIACDIGEWKQGTNALPANTKVICTDHDPNWKSCPDDVLSSPVCAADPSILPTVGCVPVSSITSDAVGPCPVKMFLKDTAVSTAIWTEAENIHCDKTIGKWKEGSSAQNTLSSAHHIICATTDPNLKSCPDDVLSSPFCAADPSILPTVECKAVSPITSDAVGPCSAKMFLKDTSGSTAIWTEAENIHCDKTIGKWKEGSSAQNTLSTVHHIICATNDPNPISCAIVNPLKQAQCGGFASSVGCTAVTFNGNVVDPCATPATKYYVKVAGGSGIWEEAATVTCDESTGEWQAEKAADNVIKLHRDDEIMCTLKNPNSETCTCTAPLPASCTGLPDDVECVEIVPFGDAPDCPSGKNLYFKQNDEATTKWMAAMAIRCESTKWQIKYKFGKTDKNDEFSADTGKIICTKSNPDPIACNVIDSAPSGFNRKKYQFLEPTNLEAGNSATCKPPPAESTFTINPERYEFFNPTIEDDYLSSPPVCSAEGKWMRANGEEFGDKIGCRYPECLKCNIEYATTTTYKLATANEFGSSTVQATNTGTCAALKCELKDKFVLEEEGDVLRKVHSGEISCSDDKTWKINENSIAKIACVQKLLCYEPHLHRVDLECPTDVTGCTKADYTSGDPETLKCAQGKMLIRHNTVQNWYHGKTSEIKCNTETGKWDIDIIDQYGKEKAEELDYDHTIICAPENPKPWPTTTTTTTTLAPVLPICEVCNSTNILPKAIECDKCDGAHIKLTSHTDDECEMTSSNIKEYKLVINSMEEVDKLVCKRAKPLKWTKPNGTEPVMQFAARVEQKREKLPTAAYIIIAAVIIAIGGMGIGCVMIYRKMRKETSEKEKKKERGTTKKYNASSVMKTGGKKSSKKASAKDSGTSRESTPSKAEAQIEDAPTLKL